MKILGVYFLINNLPIDLTRSWTQHWRFETNKNRYKESDHCIKTYSSDCLGFSVVPILSAQFIKSNYFFYSTSHQAFLHSNSAETIFTRYRNFSTHYLITEMSMRQGYAFGTRITISEEIMKTLKCTTYLVTISFESYFV